MQVPAESYELSCVCICRSLPSLRQVLHHTRLPDLSRTSHYRAMIPTELAAPLNQRRHHHSYPCRASRTVRTVRTQPLGVWMKGGCGKGEGGSGPLQRFSWRLFLRETVQQTGYFRHSLQLAVFRFGGERTISGYEGHHRSD